MARKTIPPGQQIETSQPRAATAEPQSKPAVVRRIDGKVLILAIAAVLLCAGGVHLVHSLMVGRNAAVLLDRANAEQKDGNYREAARYVARYLRLRPGDVDALEQLADLLRRSSNSRADWIDVLASLEQVLRLEPHRTVARRMAIETAIKLRRFSDADRHLQQLFLRQPELSTNRDLMLAAARVATGMEQGESGISRYLAIIDRHPEMVVPYVELAEILHSRSLELPTRADIKVTKDSLKRIFPEQRGEASFEAVVAGLLELMVEDGVPKGEAFLARANYRNNHGDLAGASTDLRQAAGQPGAEGSEFYLVAASVELAQARLLREEGSSDEATSHFEAARDMALKGLATPQPEPMLHGLLAEITLEQAGDRDRQANLTTAEDHLRAGLDQVEASRRTLKPGDFEEAQQLAETEVQLRFSLAEVLLDRLTLVAGQRAKRGATKESAEEKDLAALADKEVQKLRESGCRLEILNFLEARQLVAERRWQDAVAALERTRVALADFPDLRRRIDLTLGTIFQIVENPDQRVEVFRRALADDRLWKHGRMELAKALADPSFNFNRIDEAIQQYQIVSDVPEAALEAARLALLREWRKPVQLRDFAAVDQFLTKVPETDSTAPEVALVRAHQAMADGNIDAAASSLAASNEKFPDEISLWQAAVVLETQRENVESAEKIAKAEDLIRDAEGRFEDGPEVRLAKVEVARLRSPEALRAELAAQLKSSSNLPADKRTELLEGLVRYAVQTKDPSLVKQVWMAILELQPASVAAWRALATLALQSDDEQGRNAQDLETALAKLRTLEGPNGPNGNYIEAAKLLREAETPKSKSASSTDKPASSIAKLERAEKLLLSTARQRPYWAEPQRLLGLLTMMKTRAEQVVASDAEKVNEQEQLIPEEKAIAFLERAFQLGDRSLETVRPLVDYHFKRGEFDRADTLIQQVERDTPGGLSQDFARIAARVAYERKGVDAAIKWTEQLASSPSSEENNTLNDLALAHLYFLKYRSLSADAQKGKEGQELLSDARDLYRKAVNQAPDKPITWFTYVVHFWRLGDKDTALSGIEEAKRALPAEPADERLLSIAQLYEVVQMPAEAAQHYRLAVEADPSDPEVRRIAADYFFRTGQLDEASIHLDYLLDPKNKVPQFAVTWARKGRALATAAAGRYDDVRRALNMLRRETQSPEEIADDLRTQLVILAGRMTLQDRRDRIEILEQLKLRTELTKDEKLQLASLCAQTNKWSQARDIYGVLLDATQEPSERAVILSEYIAAALKNEQPDANLEKALQPRLDQLRALEPTSIRTAVTVARFENAFGRPDKAAAALTGHIQRVTADESADGMTVLAAERVELQIAAEAAENLKLLDAATALFEAVAAHASRPEDALVLATYLGRRSMYAKALDVCERYAATALPDAIAVTAVNIISTGPVPADQVTRAEKLALTAQAAAPDSRRITIALAGLRSIQGQFVEAESLYRSVLATEPDNVAVLNNLAWLLAITGRDPEQAAQHIEHAIRVSGPLAALLDTRATVQLSRKRVTEAIADLEAAYADSPTGYLGFHLALAYDQAGNQERAREVLRKAFQDGLSSQDLHPAELDVYQRLLQRTGLVESRT